MLFFLLIFRDYEEGGEDASLKAVKSFIGVNASEAGKRASLTAEEKQIHQLVLLDIICL